MPDTNNIQTPDLSSYQEINYCIIIPTYNNVKTLKRVVEDCLQYQKGNNVLVVNDGCTDGSAELLEAFGGRIILLTNPENKGKGFSLRKSFKEAIKRGFEYAITIDSDGQHYASDIPIFLETIKKNPGAMIMGSRNMEQEGVPGKSSFGNKFSNFWFKVETGLTLPDTQTGFRLYPLEPLKKIKLFTTKFETEIEVLVKLAWRNVPIIPVKIKVLYDPEERVTHFRPFRDFTRISILNTYLVTLTLLYYLPLRVLKIIKKEAVKKDESNVMKAASIGFGMFMGLVPIWGFQLLIGIPLAIFFRMNKVLFITVANVSIPPMIPIIIFVSYKIGGFFVEHESKFDSFRNLTLDSIYVNFMQYVIGAIVLSVVAGAASFLGSWGILSLTRKKP